MEERYVTYLVHARERLRTSTSPGNTHIRTEFQRDFDRILFSSYFRRLQNKTQVLPLPKSDFVHNRLTHSLETSSVGRSLGIQVGAELLRRYPALGEAGFTDYDFGFMVSSACLAHDIGNPPFGHAGEKAISSYFLNDIPARFVRDLDEKQLADFQYFEGNAAGFRLLVNSQPAKTKIEGGLNLTLGTLASFSKYPKESLPRDTEKKDISLKKHGFFQSEKNIFGNIAGPLSLLQHPGANSDMAWKRFPLAFLVEAADDICYHIMDFEDGFNIGLISYDLIYSLFRKLLEDDWERHGKNVSRILDNESRIAYLRSAVIQHLINRSAAVFLTYEKAIAAGDFHSSLLDKTDAKTRSILSEILSHSVDKIYRSSTVLLIEAAGYQVLPDLLDKFIKGIFEPSGYRRYYNLIPQEYRRKDAGAYEKLMDITMYVSSMTDRYAVELYKNLNGIELPKY